MVNDSVLVLADADTEIKGWGYEKRHESIESEMHNAGIVFPYFLYPNNHDNGDVEELMEATALHDLLISASSDSSSFRIIYKKVLFS